MPDIQLLGGVSAINLGGGYTLRAPGLKGTVRVHGTKASGSRGPEMSSSAFNEALSNARIDEVTIIELIVSSAPIPSATAPIRGPDGADAFELQVPDIGPEYGQIVLSIDEAGAMHWHFPLENNLSVQTSAVRGANGSKVFRIPREVATPPAVTDTEKRGLVSMIGRKILKVLIYPISDAVLGPLTHLAVSKWEGSKRPHGIRRFLPGDRTPITSSDWSKLTQGRALLFVHGTFSTSEAGFGDLPEDTLRELARRYENRLFAFDHPSLSVDPEANSKWFFSQMPSEVSLDLDIICHSRGGLVSRYMCGLSTQFGVEPARFKVKRLVLAGVPNQGTLLANPEHMVEFLDRMTTALNIFPSNGVSDVMEALLTVVKVIGHAGLTSLKGLAAMKPGNALLEKLDQSPIHGCTFYGIGGDFEPTVSGLGAAFCKAADSLVDRVFDNSPNDLVVPTDGMRAWGSIVQIPDDRFLTYPQNRGVMHTNYFPQPETSASLLNWLR